MNAFLKIATLSVAAFAFGVSAQAAELDNASREVWGPAAPAQLATPTRAQTLVDTGRAAVKAEQARAWAAGELNFAYQEVYAVPLQRGSATTGELRMANRSRK
ncbi:MAG TPA: hypothetical protein VFR90_16655 [Methylibium sp.]|uniref:hypothetical protein n=1 Tax=Methylibium sp. TaxID=2067992 RepID=UPI002DBD3CC3|nr:hypothetical protein [Methylibium sp.]HEU4460752.1 hypothetical protein [Methylibium sp.]